MAAGFDDGSFYPNQPVTRGQFAKMVVAGLGLATANPATPSYSDVAPGSTFYQYVEGARVAGLISGYSDGTFRPSTPISRQQSNSLLGIYLSGAEIRAKGAITGLSESYPTLASWFAAEGEESLDPFSDAGAVLAVHRPPTAYLVYRGVVAGASSGALRYLQPTNSVTRAQAVAMVVRTATAVQQFAGRPAVTGLNPSSGPTAGGHQCHHHRYQPHRRHRRHLRNHGRHQLQRGELGHSDHRGVSGRQRPARVDITVTTPNGHLRPLAHRR